MEFHPSPRDNKLYMFPISNVRTCLESKLISEISFRELFCRLFELREYVVDESTRQREFVIHQGGGERKPGEKGSGRLFGQHFLSFPAISSLDANSLAVYKEANTRKSCSRFYFEPPRSAGAESYKEFK